MSISPPFTEERPSGDDGTPNQAAHAREAISRQPQPYRDEYLAALKPPDTGTPYLTRALQKYLPSLLLTDGVAVPDDPEEMRWRLFFAHSQDMQGFRADIFTGGPNDADNPHDRAYRGLRDRWPEGKTMLEGLAALWLNAETRDVLTAISHPFRTEESKARGIAPAMELLRGPHGNGATRVFADAFEELKGHKIAHKTNAIVRAYCQNAALLAPHNYCFRTYLQSIVPEWELPTTDATMAEALWRERIMRDFYHVGPAMAPYLIADWLFWLWRAGQIEWFDSYKADSVWLNALANGAQNGEIVVPVEAAVSPEAFVTYCRTLTLPPEWIPAPLWHLAFYHLPPRLVNEVLWLEEAATSPNSQSQRVAQEELVAKSPKTSDLAPIQQDRMVTSPVIYSAVETTDTGAPLMFPYPIRLAEKNWYVGFTSAETLGDISDFGDIPLIENSLSSLCRVFLEYGQPNGVIGIALDPFTPFHRDLRSDEIEELASGSPGVKSAIEEGRSESTGDEDNMEEMDTFIPLLEPVSQQPDETRHVPLRLLTHGDELYLMAFTSLESGEKFLVEPDFPRLKQSIRSTVSMFIATMTADTRIAGIIFDPGDARQHVKMRAELPQMMVRQEVREAEEILYATSLPGAVRPEMLAALAHALRAAGITESRGVLVTYIDMHQTWLIGIPTIEPQLVAKVWHDAQQVLRPFVDSDENIPDVALCDASHCRLVADFGAPLF